MLPERGNCSYAYTGSEHLTVSRDRLRVSRTYSASALAGLRIANELGLSLTGAPARMW